MKTTFEEIMQLDRNDDFFDMRKVRLSEIFLDGAIAGPVYEGHKVIVKEENASSYITKTLEDLKPMTYINLDNDVVIGLQSEESWECLGTFRLKKCSIHWTFEPVQ